MWQSSLRPGKTSVFSLLLLKYPITSLSISPAYISRCVCILATVQEERKGGGMTQKRKKVWSGMHESVSEKETKGRGGFFTRKQKRSMTKAVGPQLRADLQRGSQRVRYLTQLALHSSLPASFTPSFMLSPPSLSFMHPTPTPPPPFPLSFLPFAPFPPSHLLLPIFTLAPKACLVVPIPEFSKEKDKSREGGWVGVGGTQRRRESEENWRKQEKREEESEEGFLAGRWWWWVLILHCSWCRLLCFFF